MPRAFSILTMLGRASLYTREIHPGSHGVGVGVEVGIAPSSGVVAIACNGMAVASKNSRDPHDLEALFLTPGTLAAIWLPEALKWVHRAATGSRGTCRACPY
jgi:hypothetical protein